MEAITNVLLRNAGAAQHKKDPAKPTPDAPTPERADGYAGTTPEVKLDVAGRRGPRPGSLDTTNPVVGHAQPAPQLVAGDLKSPQFHGSEAEYFKEARRMIESAKRGDVLCLQMYELENEATNGGKYSARKAPGFADQQALLPALVEAAKRGVKVAIILDASRGKEGEGIRNAPIVDYLNKNAGSTGNMTVDYYPPESVIIDHAKELVHLTPAAFGKFAVLEAVVGGSNWGNHTAANDDGGAAFYGRDAVGPAQVFFRDLAFCRGDRTSPPNPASDDGTPVQWRVTAPRDEGGGSTGIRDAKIAETKQADEVWLNEFCLNHHGLLDVTCEKGKDAHARVDPNEFKVNNWGLWQIRKAHGQAMWANTALDPSMEGQKNHEKLDIYVQKGVPMSLTIGSANDTNSGLETTFTAPNRQTGQQEEHKTNHEIDAVVHRVTNGSYSTAGFLDAALTKTKKDLAERSLDKPPESLSGTSPGQF